MNCLSNCIDVCCLEFDLVGYDVYFKFEYIIGLMVFKKVKGLEGNNDFLYFD